MKYLVNTVDTYRVDTVEEVEQLHEDLKADSHFTLAAFSYKTKQIKVKGVVEEEYQLVVAKKLFNEEKNPGTDIEIKYEVEF
jgi:hypothetical protein